MVQTEEPVIPLEELGLYYMLERINNGTATVQDVIRVGLIRSGMVSESKPPELTDAGKHKLHALRAVLKASNE